MDTAFLKDLLASPGPSSFEARPAALWRNHAKGLGASVHSDSYGNSFASFGSGKPKVMLAGHIDEIGLLVSYIDGDGLLYVKGIGGWDANLLLGQRLRIVGYSGKDIIGIVGNKPVHLMDGDEKGKRLKLEDVWIDIGAKDAEEAKKHVRIGDVAVIDQPFVELLNGRIVSKAIDNRVSAFMILEAAKRAAEAGSNAEVVAVATVQEEIGGIGAYAASYKLEADVALAIDVTHATDMPGVNKKQEGELPLKGGVGISVGSYVHGGVFKKLISVAEAEGIPYAIETAERHTYTDADDIAKNRYGIPTGVVSLPCRYMHSPNEMVDKEDIENVIKLLTGFIMSLDETTTFTNDL